MGFMRAEQSFPVRANPSSSFLVINLMNPQTLKRYTREVFVLDLLSIYILNLIVTVAMFTVLVFRAWVEHKNYKMMWKELEWQKTCSTAGKILRAEKSLFTNVEGGEELYEMLLELFSQNNKQ